MIAVDVANVCVLSATFALCLDTPSPESSNGPARLLVSEMTRIAVTNTGTLFAYVYALRDAVYWSLGVSFTRVGDAYTRGEATTNLTFEF